jgi:uncharacterized protein (TIGR02996 family)
MSAYAVLVDEEVLRTALIGYPVRHLKCSYQQYAKLKDSTIFLLGIQPVDGSLWLAGVLKGLAYGRGECLSYDASRAPVIEITGFERVLGVGSGPAGVLDALAQPRELSTDAVAQLERSMERARAGQRLEITPNGTLAAVLANPDDDGPRLAYAAELRQNSSGVQASVRDTLLGLPLPWRRRAAAPVAKGADRAELIEIQIRLAHRPASHERATLRKRELEILALNSKVWWPFGLSTWRAHRGFLTSVALDIGHLESVATQLFALEPIQELELIDATEAAIRRLAKLTGIRVRSLLVRGRIGDAGVKELGAAPFMPDLQRLNVAGNGIGPDGVAELTASARGPLETLVLTDDRIGDDGAARLGASELRRSLRRLYLTRCGLGAEGLEALLVQGMPRLETLCLGENDLDDDGAEVLAAHAERLPSLRHLELPATELGDTGVQALVGSKLDLKRLDVRRNPIQDFEPLHRRFRSATLRTTV